MDFIIGYLTQLGISTVLSAPRIFIGDYPESRYEEIAPALVDKLPNLKALRNKLTVEQLREVSNRERIPFDELYNWRTGNTLKKHVDPTTGDFVPFTSEKAIPSLYQDVRINFDHGMAFALPNSNWAGPLWSGGRFLKPGETLTEMDLAVLPSDQVDMISRRHDIHYALIATIPDDEERDELKKIANSIYALSLWQENDFPKETNEIGSWYYRFVQQVLPTVIGISNIYNTVTSNYQQNFETLLRTYQDLNAIVPMAPRNLNLDAPVGSSVMSDIVLNGNPVRFIRGEAFRQLYIDSVVNNDPNYGAMFRNPAIRDALQIPEIENRLVRIGELASNTTTPVNQLNAMIDTELRSVDLLMRSDVNMENLPSYRDVISSEAWAGLLNNKEFWKSLGLMTLLSATFSYLAERQLDRKSRDDIEFRNRILGANIDYRRAHPLWNRLAEVTFRLDFGFGIPYHKLSDDQINLYISALEPPIPDDPIVAAVRKYQKQENIELEEPVVEKSTAPGFSEKEAAFTQDDQYPETGQSNLIRPDFSEEEMERAAFIGYKLMKEYFTINQPFF